MRLTTCRTGGLNLPSPTVSLEFPVQIHFSNYRRVQNCPVAYHIQVYMNGALFWAFNSHRPALIIEDVSVPGDGLCVRSRGEPANFD